MRRMARVPADTCAGRIALARLLRLFLLIVKRLVLQHRAARLELPSRLQRPAVGNAREGDIAGEILREE